ncbi:P-loop containing nucleoside triphosphate hydrolase protein [Scenedesmus sp. NREL 46B-D3]|nr:P-loop containing nucleoside triphosphate hydrolase protein [Scenedesmus sp. NREL 46B-D3]
MDQATVVCVRLRPSFSKETGVRCIRTEGEQDVTFTNPDRSLSSYRYDKVYGEESAQADVFKDCQHIVASVLNGYNGTILAYGQTGSGKTHTLIGSMSSPELQGIVPRAVQALGEGIAADTSGAEYEVRLSVVETYCERIRDLLDPSRDNLQVRTAVGGLPVGGLLVMQSPTGAIFVDGALEAQVGNEEQLVQVMHTGLAARTVAATCMNEASSRSHCIVTVTVEKCCPDGSVLVGKLKMVDLAGSERQDKTQTAGQTLVEGSQINKSLSALANVIYALTDAGNSSTEGGEGGSGGHPSVSAKHVPYRDSKLTRILQDSLGGTSRTMLIICCSPCRENGPETLSSLRFGTRARGIKNKVAVNTRLSPELLQQQLAKANARIKELEKQLAEEQERTSSATTAPSSSSIASSAAAIGSSTHGKSSINNGSKGEVNASSMPHGSNGVQQLGKAGCESFTSRMLSKRVVWWQHAVVTGLSVVCTMGYMGWEASWRCSTGGLVCAN